MGPPFITPIVGALCLISLYCPAASGAEEARETKAETKIYDVSTLIHSVPPFPLQSDLRPPTQLQQKEFSGSVSGTSPLHEPVAKPEDMSRSDDLIKLIESTIDSDSWRDMGGSLGTILRFDDLLIVTQTKEAHARLAALLGELRKASRSSRPIHVRADWLLLDVKELKAILKPAPAGAGARSRPTSAKLTRPRSRNSRRPPFTPRRG